MAKGWKETVSNFDNADRVKLLGVIDHLRELGISDDIPLPQLVVVGDQSSGKSSLLEGLTGLAFPIASDLCTRFATQIVLRRTPAEEATVKVTIIPGPEAQTNEHLKTYLAGFKHTSANAEFGADEFAGLLGSAAERMGLPKPGTEDVEDLEHRFSEHVLKVELSGPEHPHLSVVDVPGLFHNPTKYQTKEDAIIIRNLILSYIRDRRTIIMAIMDGRNNLANQEVFRMAKAADPNGSRTVGVVTKCDALQPGEELGVLRILENSVEHLKHGWFGVKNRSAKDIKNKVTIEERHVNEENFFTTYPWSTLPKERVGIKPLKAFLGKLLYEHIRNEFPALVRDIEARHAESIQDLENMGAPRTSASEQRVYLTKVVNEYQLAVNKALAGTYPSGLSSTHPLKLRMHAHVANTAFVARIANEGHSYQFMNANNVLDPNYKPRTSGGVYEWIRAWYKESRGAELPGTVNPAVVESLFRQQSAGWVEIANTHLMNMEDVVTHFNDALFRETVADVRIRENIISHMQPLIMAGMEAAEEELARILRDEREGTLLTFNKIFETTLNTARLDRIIARMSTHAVTPSNTVSGYASTIAGYAHLSLEDQAVYDIHDILKTFYKIAVERFTDNVVVQVIERHLLGASGPVKSFSVEHVGGLLDSEVADIAGDDLAMRTRRAEINSRIRRLNQAMDIAKKVSRG